MIKEMKEMMGKCVSMMDNCCSPSREPKNEEEKKGSKKSTHRHVAESQRQGFEDEPGSSGGRKMIGKNHGEDGYPGH